MARVPKPPLEWGLVSVAQHEALSALLPAVPGDPATEIFLGHEEPGGA